MGGEAEQTLMIAAGSGDQQTISRIQGMQDSGCLDGEALIDPGLGVGGQEDQAVCCGRTELQAESCVGGEALAELDAGADEVTLFGWHTMLDEIAVVFAAEADGADGKKRPGGAKPFGGGEGRQRSRGEQDRLACESCSAKAAVSPGVNEIHLSVQELPDGRGQVAAVAAAADGETAHIVGADESGGQLPDAVAGLEVGVDFRE